MEIISIKGIKIFSNWCNFYDNFPQTFDRLLVFVNTCFCKKVFNFCWIKKFQALKLQYALRFIAAVNNINNDRVFGIRTS